MSARRHPLPLPEAATRALRPLRHTLDDLKSGKRLDRGRAIARLEGAIADLKLGLKTETDAATGDLSGDLLCAIGPGFTVGEIERARSVLGPILAALPPKISLGPDRD